jgi:hypothetical protein
MSTPIPKIKEEPDFSQTSPLPASAIIKLENEYSFTESHNDLPTIKVEPDYLLERHWVSGSPRSCGPEKSPSQIWNDHQQLALHIDPVSEEIIAKLDTPTLFRRAPEFAKHALSFTLENSTATFELRSEEERLRKIECRGFWKSLSVKGVIGDMLRLLQEGSLVNIPLFRTASTNEWKNELGAYFSDTSEAQLNLRAAAGYCHVGVFTVDKTSNHEDGLPWQRMIMDARLANAWFQNPVPIELFSLESLLSVVSGQFQKKETVHVISADLRHWFHQIPCPKKFAKHYFIKLQNKNQQQQKTSISEKDILFPRAWPMGASPAPGIGQMCTWALLLHDFEKCDRSRSRFGVEQTGSLNKALPWFPLRGGGGVFVLIDNILIITTENLVAEAWLARLKTFKTLFRAELKDDPKITTISPTDNSSYFEFAGIEFSRQGRRPRNPVDMIKELEQTTTKSDQRGERLEWRSTYRYLASIVGQCLWAFRVRGIKMIDDRLSCYRQICSKCYPKKPSDWDKEVSFSGDDFINLQKMYHQCRSDLSFTPFPPSYNLDKIVYLATDASLEKGVAGLGAVWSLEESMLDQPPSYKAWRIDVGNNSQIALEELRAVLLTIEAILEQHKEDPPNVFVLAIDSVHARSLIERGAAHTEMGRDLLNKIYEKLDGRRLIMRYIESKLNPADNPSRGRAVHKECWENVLERLSSIKAAAIEKSFVSGKQIMKQKITNNHTF